MFKDPQIIDVVGMALVGIIGYVGKNIRELNESIKIIILRVDTHEKFIDDHETRIRDIEKPR